jgi:hypothetical protein
MRVLDGIKLYTFLKVLHRHSTNQRFMSEVLTQSSIPATPSIDASEKPPSWMTPKQLRQLLWSCGHTHRYAKATEQIKYLIDAERNPLLAKHHPLIKKIKEVAKSISFLIDDLADGVGVIYVFLLVDKEISNPE